MRRWLASLLLVLVAVILVFAASCGPQEGEAKTYKLGFLGPLTGPAAPWILPMYYGIEMALNDINEAGGIVVGGETYTLELASADDKYVAEDSVTAVQKLIYDDKVDYIYGPIGPTCGSAVRPITEDNGVVIFVGTSATDDFPIGPNYPHTFTYMDPFTFRISSGYQWIEDNHPEVTRVAHIAPNTTDGQGGQERVREQAEARGMEVVAAELYESGTVDFVPYLTVMTESDPQLIDCSGVPSYLIGLVVKEARQMGYEGLLMAAPYPNAALFGSSAGEENAEGFIGIGTPLAEKGTPEQRDFYQTFVDEYGEESWGAGAMWGYDWAYWMVQAFEQADSFAPELVVAALEGSEFDGVQGTLWFGGAEEWGVAHQRIASPICVVIFQNGEWEPDAYYDVTGD